MHGAGKARYTRQTELKPLENDHETTVCKKPPKNQLSAMIFFWTSATWPINWCIPQVEITHATVDHL